MREDEIAAALETRSRELATLWWDLGPNGPTYGATEVGDRNTAMARYLHPLTRVLIGALRGSPDHLAVYLDERLRYRPPALTAGARAASLTGALHAEFEAIAGLLPTLDQQYVIDVFSRLHDHLMNEAEHRARVLFVGDCLFVETRAFLAPLARQHGRPLDIRQAFFSARQPMANRNDAVINTVQSEKPDLIGISLFSFEGIPPYQAAWQDLALPRIRRRATVSAAAMVAVLDETICDIRTVTDSTIAIHTPAGLPLDRYRRRIPLVPPHSRAQRRLLGELSERIGELVEGTTNTILIDENALLADPATERPSSRTVRQAAATVFDERDVPLGYFHATRFGPTVANAYDRILADLILLGRRKAILVDFDNTLWRGVMGDGTVVHDQVGQRLLKELKEAGVLLVALSKNDHATIRWPEMILQPEDFALMKINWRPKPDNVAEAIHELDLAADAFVLLDDNPVERVLVTENVPGVAALDPLMDSSWASLRRWLDFPSTTQTPEAARRTDMYREAAERRAAISSTHDYAAMMSSLELRYTFRPAESSDLPRLMELVQRTNQFNTTTRRRTTAEISGLIESASMAVYVASLRDRFGDLGVVATAIFDRGERSFDSLIMSCRAMGFGLDQAVLSQVIDVEVPMGQTVSGRFVPTDRNGPAGTVFADAGFIEDGDGSWVLHPTASRPQVPTWFNVTGSQVLAVLAAK